MSIDDDKKRENGSVKNSLMNNLKIKNEFEEEQEKNKNKKTPTLIALRKGWVNDGCTEEKPFKIHAKRKKIITVKV